MPSKPKRPLKPVTPQEKLAAIQRVHDGESKASVARNMGVPESTLRGWCKNETKISYLSRQSSPETDESAECHQPTKRIKLEDAGMQPYDMTFKSNGAHSQESPLDCSKVTPAPLNMTVKSETPRSSVADRDRNRAELAKISANLGLNRAESIPFTSMNRTDLDNRLMAHYVMMQHQHQLSIGTSQPAADFGGLASTSGGLLAIADPDKRKYAPREPQSVHDSVSKWLQTQMTVPPPTNGFTAPGPNSPVTEAASASPWIAQIYKNIFNMQLQQMGQDPRTILFQQLTKNNQPPTRVSPQPSSRISPQPSNRVSPQPSTQMTDSSRAAQIKLSPHSPRNESPQIKSPSPSQNALPQNDSFRAQNGENLAVNYERPASTVFDQRYRNHKRMALDNLMNNNFMNAVVKEEPLDEAAMSLEEALDHGDKFVRWLETACSHPSVTATLITQIRALLSSVRGGNCDLPNKAKVKRK